MSRATPPATRAVGRTRAIPADAVAHHAEVRRAVARIVGSLVGFVRAFVLGYGAGRGAATLPGVLRR